MRSVRGFRAILLTSCVLVMTSTTAVRADDPVVADQRFDLGGRLELMLTPSMSIFDKYTRHFGGSLGIAYFFNDYVGLELDAGGFYSGDRKLLDEILRTSTTLDGVERLPLTDLKHMTWFANLGVLISPLYGKLNFSAEFAVSIHLYFVLGAGVAQYMYTELDHNDPNPEFESGFSKKKKTYSGGLTDAAVQPTFQFGGGLLFHFTDHWSLRIEIRDVFFYDDYNAQINDQVSGVVDEPITDFVHIVLLRLGVGYAF
jgi:outer membrane beta-barrel protein